MDAGTTFDAMTAQLNGVSQPAPVSSAQPQNSSTPDNPHVPVNQLPPGVEDTAADNAPAVEPGQNPEMPPAQVAPPAPATAPVQQGEEKPSFSDTLAAAFEQNNIISSAYERMIAMPDSNAPAQPGYDPWNDIKGTPYEADFQRFAGSTSPQQTQVIKERIDQQNENERTLQQAGWEGTALSFGAGVLDPTTVAMMAIPGVDALGVTSRIARVAAGVGTNVVLGEAQQRALSAIQGTDPNQGMGLRVASNALLAGVFGTLATRVPKPEFDALADRTQTALDAPQRVVPIESTAGAAAAHMTSLEQESIATGGQFLAKTIGHISPATTVLASSPEVESRRLVQRLVDVPLTMAKNEDGIATPTSVEMRAQRQENLRNFQFTQEYDAQYKEYRQNGGELSKNDFGKQVIFAANHNDQHEVPQVAALARWMRPVFNQDRTTLNEMGKLPEGFDVLGDPSYFPRVWNQHAVATRQTALEDTLRNHFLNHPHTEPFVETPIKGAEDIEHEDLGQGAHVFRSKNGESHFQESNGYLLEKRTDTIPEAQGNGEGTARLAAAGKYADENGLKLGSDVSMSEDAMKMWEKYTGKSGYELKRNAHEQVQLEGPDGKPVTRYIGKEPGVPIVERARPEPKPRFQEPAEVDAAVRDTIDNITGMVRGTADLGSAPNKPKPLKARKLDLAYDQIKDYLSNDLEQIWHSYNHTILPHIEMLREFGSTDLTDELQNISDRYRTKITAAGTDDAAKNRLYEAQASDVKNLTYLRDKVLNQVGPRGDASRFIVRAGQIIRGVNYMRMLGGQTLSALTDWGRLVARYGLARTSARTAQFLASPAVRKALMGDANRMGTALDYALHTRMHSLDGIASDLSGDDRLSRFMRNQTNLFTKMSLIAHWDSFMRVMSSALEQDHLAQAVNGTARDFDMAKLAAHGIGADDLSAIREQWTKYGQTDGYLNRARTELWDDKDAAQKVELAIQRAASQNAFFVGKGDLPRWSSSEAGKFFLQFKAFVASSVNRLMIPLAQGLAHRDINAANGLVAMLTLGAMSYAAKEFAAGREPDLSPENLMTNAMQRSGVLAFLPDMYDPVAGMLHLPRFAKFQDLDPVETLMGPTYGTMADLMSTATQMSGGNITAHDMHKLRQLLPYSNLFYANRLVNALEGETEDTLGLPGAPNRALTDYFNPSMDTSPAQGREDNKHFLGIQSIPNEF